LTHFVASRTEISDVDSIAAYWGRIGTGVSDKNRSEGALVFGRLSAAAGLAKFIVGRSGQKSRLQWDLQASSQIEEAKGVSSPSPRVEATQALDLPAPTRAPVNAPASRQIASKPETESFRLVTPQGEVGRLELPVSVDQDDLRALQAQIDAIFTLVRARLGVLAQTSRSPGD
jgi:hypothetical protein